MLSHANIFYQVEKFDFFVRLGPGDQTLSLLPPWHIYERTVGYYIFSCGCKQVLAPGLTTALKLCHVSAPLARRAVRT